MTSTAKKLLAAVCIVAMLAGTMLPSAATPPAKLSQTITVQPFGIKVYGDAPFKVTVTPDADSGLTDFIYISSNTDVADISNDGTITIKATGETEITVVQLGNDEYSSATSTQTLVVNKKEVSIASIDLNNKTAVLDGILPEDEGKVRIDFNKLMLEVKPPEKEYAYILDTTVTEPTFGSAAIVKIQMLTDNGVEILEIGNHAKVNDTVIYTENNSCSDQNHYACDNTCAYKAISAIPVNEIVAFIKNDAGKVLSITTAGYSDSFDGHMYTDPIDAEYDLENGSLNGVGYIDPDTKVFAIDIVAQNSRVVTLDALEDKNYYTVLGMYATDKANDNDIVVIDLASLMSVGATSNIAVITGVAYNTNENVDAILTLSYFENSEDIYADTVGVTDLAIISEDNTLDAYDISAGDIVKLKLDSNGLVCAIKFVVNFTEDTVRDYNAKNTVVAVDTTGSGNEVFDGGYVTAYNEKKSIATLNTGNQYKLSNAVNTYVIAGTSRFLYIDNGYDTDFSYFDKLYGTEPVALYFSDRASAPDIDNVVVAEAQKYADHIYVRAYEDRVTDVVILKGALKKVTAASGSNMSAYSSNLAIVSELPSTSDDGEEVYKLECFIPSKESEEDEIGTDIIHKGSITEISNFTNANKLTALSEEFGVIEDDYPISGGGSGSGSVKAGTSTAIAKVDAYNLCLEGEMAENYELLETRIENLSVYKSNLAEVSVVAEGEDGVVTGSGTYLWGSSVTVSAVPCEGNTFEGWYLEGECVSTQNEYTVFVLEDTYLVARFGVDATISTETVYTEKDGKWLFITSIKNCPENAELAIALYAGDRMIDFKATKDFTDGYAPVYLDKNSFDKAKIMLWDVSGSLKPLAEVKEIMFK